MLTQFLNENTIAVRQRAADKDQAIRLAGDLLVKQGLVDPRYVDQMIQAVNEMGPYIVISPGIAFAHARPSELVREDCVSMITLAEPVTFGHKKNDPVSVLFVLAARRADHHLTVMKEIAKLIIRPGFLQRMAEMATVEDLQRYLAEE